MKNIDKITLVLTVAAALGCGLMAGTFFAFSTFIMGALARLHPASGIAAMQSINIRVINPAFMGVFMGTIIPCIVLAIFSLLNWQRPGAAFLLCGSLFYCIGTFGVTVAFNVPLNDALARVHAHSPDAARIWATYLTNWTLWNHVRTVGALLAAASFTLALYSRTSP